MGLTRFEADSLGVLPVVGQRWPGRGIGGGLVVVPRDLRRNPGDVGPSAAAEGSRWSPGGVDSNRPPPPRWFDRGRRWRGRDGLEAAPVIHDQARRDQWDDTARAAGCRRERSRRPTEPAEGDSDMGFLGARLFGRVTSARERENPAPDRSAARPVDESSPMPR